HTMRRYFERAYGPHAEEQINGLVTELANEASERRISWNMNYCLFAVALFDHVLALSPGTLGAFARHQPFAASHGVVPCRRCAGGTASRGGGALLQDDLDASVLRLADAVGGRHERIGLALGVDDDVLPRHAVGHQFALHRGGAAV